jgi:CTD small phosphatase-like protein 2
MTHLVSVRKRPFLHEFLSQVAKLFEVVVFTASQQIYAEQLLDIVDPDSKYIQHRVYRDSCVVWEGNYLKDLTVLGRDLAQTIIVDNSPQAFGFQLENGVPIESWYDDDNDTALLQLIPFLEQLIHVEDVRPVISKKFGLRELVKAAPDILFE